MEDSTVSNGGEGDFFSPSAASVSSVHLGESDEVLLLRKQLDLLSDETRTYASRIAGLETDASANAREREDMARRINELQVDLKALDAVAARANVLEGEVAFLREELDVAVSGNEAAQLEIEKLKSDIEALSAQKYAVDAVITSMNERIASLVAEKAGVELKVADRERRINELEGLLDSRREMKDREVKELAEKLDRAAIELKQKDALLNEAQVSAASALEELTMLKEFMEVVTDTRDADMSDVYEESRFCRGSLKNPWMVAAASVGAVTTVTAIVYLHLSKKRLA